MYGFRGFCTLGDPGSTAAEDYVPLGIRDLQLPMMMYSWIRDLRLPRFLYPWGSVIYCFRELCTLGDPGTTASDDYVPLHPGSTASAVYVPLDPGSTASEVYVPVPLHPGSTASPVYVPLDPGSTASEVYVPVPLYPGSSASDAYAPLIPGLHKIGHFGPQRCAHAQDRSCWPTKTCAPAQDRPLWLAKIHPCTRSAMVATKTQPRKIYRIAVWRI